MKLKEEIQHALALLTVSILVAITFLAARSPRHGLVGWPLGIGVALLVVWLGSFSLRWLAGRMLTKEPARAISVFEVSWLRWAVPAGAVLAVPLVTAAKFPTRWTGDVNSAQVLKLVIGFAVIEAIKLLALDGKWLQSNMETSARAMFRHAFENANFAKFTNRWHAVLDDHWQGGWGKSARSKRAKALTYDD
jgi:hypothetical protein